MSEDNPETRPYRYQIEVTALLQSNNLVLLREVACKYFMKKDEQNEDDMENYISINTTMGSTHDRGSE